MEARAENSGWLKEIMKDKLNAFAVRVRRNAARFLGIGM